jgi:hypothetical protein
MSKVAIADIPVLLPSLRNQEEFVQADADIVRLTAELQELRDKIWTRPQRLKEHVRALAAFGGRETAQSAPAESGVREEPLHLWLENLPFPLASVLWRYHASGRSNRDRYELLLQFLEAVTEYLAIVFLSAFQNSELLFANLRSELVDILKRNRVTYDPSSFGTWRTVVEYLAKRGRTMINGKPEDREACMALFCTRDTEVLSSLFSSKLVSTLGGANALRNSRIGHHGAVSDQLASEWHETLLPLLADVRAVFGIRWCRYELLQPLSCEVLEGAYQYEARRLMGSRAPFEKVQRHTSDRLVTDQLYVMSSDMGRAFKLLPLVKVGPTPVKEPNSCFFFNRRENGKLKFISYHYEQKPELVEDFPDARDALDMLSDRGVS